MTLTNNLTMKLFFLFSILVLVNQIDASSNITDVLFSNLYTFSKVSLIFVPSFLSSPDKILYGVNVTQLEIEIKFFFVNKSLSEQIIFLTYPSRNSITKFYVDAQVRYNNLKKNLTELRENFLDESSKILELVNITTNIATTDSSIFRVEDVSPIHRGNNTGALISPRITLIHGFILLYTLTKFI